MSINSLGPDEAATKKCECCGKILVRLRRYDIATGKITNVLCYAKFWNGNPWYVPGRERVHQASRRRQEKEENTDLSLD